MSELFSKRALFIGIKDYARANKDIFWCILMEIKGSEMPKGVSHKLDLISGKSPQFCLTIL